jgi:hypothetical protein
MTPFAKKFAVLGLAGTFVAGGLTPASAENWWPWAAAGAGFVAGAAIASSAANPYYGPGYYGPYAYDAPAYSYGPSYSYAPTYSYGPFYSGPSVSVGVGPAYVARSPGRCWVSTDDRGYGYWRGC